MPDLRKLTVRKLRELARKQLGAGASRLRTKSALVEALEQAPESEQVRRRPAAAPRAAKGATIAPAKGPNPKANGARLPAPATPAPALPAKAEPKKKAAKPEPKFLEGFEEELGELPDSYGEDSVVLLPKDPTTLYLHWDFTGSTLERAFAWMPGLKTRLRLFEGERLVREIPFSVAARSWYLRDLLPGRTYRVELTAFAEDGQIRRIGPSSNPARLPPAGPSSIREARFVRVLLDLPAGRVAKALEGREIEPPEEPATAMPGQPRGRRPVRASPLARIVPTVEAPPEGVEAGEGGETPTRKAGSSEQRPSPSDEGRSGAGRGGSGT